MKEPIINIETIGYKDYLWGCNDIKTLYIPSLTYNSQILFIPYNRTVYVPIIFFNESAIKNIFKYYNDLYFQIEYTDFPEGSQPTKIYHVSKLLTLRKTSFSFKLNFFIRYKNHRIELEINDYYFGSFSSGDNINKLIKNKKALIDEIHRHYTTFPIFMWYRVWPGDKGNTFKNIEDAMKFIDTLQENEKKLNENLDSCYSVKSFKLVED